MNKTKKVKLNSGVAEDVPTPKATRVAKKAVPKVKAKGKVSEDRTEPRGKAKVAD
jgi:hypothetical protein